MKTKPNKNNTKILKCPTLWQLHPSGGDKMIEVKWIKIKQGNGLLGMG
jgi:hypothetical protein